MFVFLEVKKTKGKPKKTKQTNEKANKQTTNNRKEKIKAITLTRPNLSSPLPRPFLPSPPPRESSGSPDPGLHRAGDPAT
jgi:hypothetical protein